MKLLILDCNKFEYKLDHKTAVGEEVSKELMQGKYDNPLMIFISIEEKDQEITITEIAKDIRRIARKNGTNLIILNPFAHLSSSLARPEKAVSILENLTKKLQECHDFKTIRSVFGWYKQFIVDVKGHDTSQIYREY